MPTNNAKQKCKVCVAKVSNDVIVGRVYKLFNSYDDFIYIGSTVVNLATRMSKHIYKLNHNEKTPLYEHMRLINVENWTIHLLEAKFVKNITELRKLEQNWIDKENPKNLLNFNNAIMKDLSLRDMKSLKTEIENIESELNNLDINNNKLNDAQSEE